MGFCVRTIGPFCLRFIHSHSGATGVFLPFCRVVYFRCGAKLTDASSKIDVRRLEMENFPSNAATASS